MTQKKENNSVLKEELYQQCHDFIEERLLKIKNQIKEINTSLEAETKSSAGDKHETGRAMLQLEREKVGQQLAEVEKLKEALTKIEIQKFSKTAGLGSVILTSGSNYFVSISAGQLEVDSTMFYAISPNTSIALVLSGKRVGDEVIFRDQKFIIKCIF